MGGIFAGRGVKPAAVPLGTTLTPLDCQKAFLRSELSKFGLPTNQVDNLKFVAGLDAKANHWSRFSLSNGAEAVTQGNTVYVQPRLFDRYANFRSPDGFEEVYHTGQFASDGSSFYPRYTLLGLGGALFGGGAYSGNIDEAFAKGRAKQMYEDAQTHMCHA